MDKAIEDLINLSTVEAYRASPCIHKPIPLFDIENGRSCGIVCRHCHFQLTEFQYEWVKSVQTRENEE